MLARYSILEDSGRGATGAVYAARDRKTGAVVALKKIDPALFNRSGANFTARFLKEARSAGRLRHRNIVKVEDAGEAGGTVFVAMEMLEGESLRKILDDGPLPIARAIRIAQDIACGLAYAILKAWCTGASRRRASWSCARARGRSQVSAWRGPAAPATCPEQVRGDAMDHQCDLFSLGAVFYEMFAQRPAFDAARRRKSRRRFFMARRGRRAR